MNIVPLAIHYNFLNLSGRHRVRINHIIALKRRGFKPIIIFLRGVSRTG